MYRAGLESIFGLRRHGETFELDPCIPTSWPEYAISWRFGRTRYEISVTNPERRCRGIGAAELDGVAVDPRAIALIDDGGTHDVRVVLGGASQRVAASAGPHHIHACGRPAAHAVCAGLAPTEAEPFN